MSGICPNEVEERRVMRLLADAAADVAPLPQRDVDGHAHGGHGWVRSSGASSAARRSAASSTRSPCRGSRRGHQLEPGADVVRATTGLEPAGRVGCAPGVIP